MDIESIRTTIAKNNASRNYINIPSVTEKVRGPRGKYQSKYKTDEERLQAKKEAQRRYYYRKRYGRDTLEPPLELTRVYKMDGGQMKRVYKPINSNENTKVKPMQKSLIWDDEDELITKNETYKISSAWDNYFQALGEKDTLNIIKKGVPKDIYKLSIARALMYFITYKIGNKEYPPNYSESTSDDSSSLDSEESSSEY